MLAQERNGKGPGQRSKTQFGCLQAGAFKSSRARVRDEITGRSTVRVHALLHSLRR